MGRSRGVPNSAEDLGQRSKRKRAASSAENTESSAAAQGTADGKRALYHCNYCNKDISGKIRIKCFKCPDFDLCVECFSVGAEVTPHKSNHSYRVMDSLSFPLICADWNADEEILLLEGIEMYGLGNWAEVAEHVGTKSKAQCIDHYTNCYINSTNFPLPDMSHAAGKNRKELLAMAKVQGVSTPGELMLKEEYPFSPSRVKIEDASFGRSPSGLPSESGVGSSSGIPPVAQKSLNMAQIKKSCDDIKMEDAHVDRSILGNTPKPSKDEGPSLIELSGYNPKRHEFEPEYDNDAEQAIADMEFKDTDDEAERELKLRMLRIYCKRLDERKRRKDFILERNLLYPDPLAKDLTPDEKEIYDRFNVFMRFHAKEEHEELIKTVLTEHRIRKRIQLLQEARDAGCSTISEADKYIEWKRKREAEEAALNTKESGLSGPNGKVLQRTNRPKGETVGNPGAESSSGHAFGISLDDWDVTGLPGADLLSLNEIRVCRETKMIPTHYLKMQEVISMEIFKGTVAKKSDTHGLFKLDPSKIDKVYDMLVKKGIAPP
ncbi:hypothetical protein Syun_009575 [Stephania yunnanensis]|uniref:Transcriptional adapter n=1 Tax=Stephania yunnanensis TaxID=152371 RepID=A0AAP0KEP8_9MAGN